MAAFSSWYLSRAQDLKNDPNELKSGADDHSQVLTYLRSKLDEYLASGKDLTGGTFSQEL
jgi:hypothetical protein